MSRRNLYAGTLPLAMRLSDLSAYFFDGMTKSVVEEFGRWACAELPKLGRCKRYNTKKIQEAMDLVCERPDLYANCQSIKEAREAIDHEN
jgi:hypothetical protein